MAKNTTGASAGMTKKVQEIANLTKGYAEYREANQPQRALMTRTKRPRIGDTLPDGNSRRQNKPTAQTRLQSAVSNSAAGRVSKQGNAPAMSANAAVHRMPLKGFEPGEKRNLLQKGRSNKIK